jgi:hypothetical protein
LNFDKKVNICFASRLLFAQKFVKLFVQIVAQPGPGLQDFSFSNMKKWENLYHFITKYKNKPKLGYLV